MSTSPSTEFAKATIQGTFWRYLTFFSGKLMLLISTVVLARILSKDDFGVVGYAVTTINLLDILSDMGIGPALIYHSEDEKTSSTAFWLNIIVSVALFGLAWILAPLIALYFRDERATDVIRILSLSFPIIAIGNTHQKLIEKRLSFSRTFLPEFLRSLTKGLTTIACALFGFGAWSLIIGQLSGEIVSTISYWLSLRWVPRLHIDRAKARALLDYGVKYVGADSIAVLLLNLDYLLVGRYLGAEALGIYTIAFRLPDLVVLQFARTLSGVIFPVYSRMRETTQKLGLGFLMTTRYISLITVPMGVGLALVAEPFTEVMFSAKWLDAAPAIQGIAIYSMLLSLTYNAGGAYKASGRPQINTWLGLVRLGILLPALWWAVSAAGSIVAVSWMHALVALISVLLSLYVATRLLELQVLAVVSALFPAFLAGSIMAVVVPISLWVTTDMAPVLQLILGVLTGGSSYLLALWVFQRPVVMEASQKLKLALGRR